MLLGVNVTKEFKERFEECLNKLESVQMNNGLRKKDIIVYSIINVLNRIENEDDAALFDLISDIHSENKEGLL